MTQPRTGLVSALCLAAAFALLGCPDFGGAQSPSAVFETLDTLVLDFCCPTPALVPIIGSTHPSYKISLIGRPDPAPLTFELVTASGEVVSPTTNIEPTWVGTGPEPHFLRVSFGPCAALPLAGLEETIELELKYTYSNVPQATVVKYQPIRLESSCAIAATLSWEPWIPLPGETCTVRMHFDGTCPEESRFLMNYYGGASPTLGEIVLPAFSADGFDTFSNPNVGVSTFHVESNPSPCYYVSGFSEYLVHPAGAEAFDEHTGAVMGDAGAMGTMSLRVVYSLRTDPGGTTNAVIWRLSYAQTDPVAFTMDLDIATTHLGYRGSWTGPDGEYDWSFGPHLPPAYAGTLSGNFVLTRPDGTVETIPYSLTKP